MEAKPQGSFGMPAHMKKSMEDHQRKKEAPEVKPEEPKAAEAPADPAKVVGDEDIKSKEREEFLKLKLGYEERLGLTLSEEVISDYLFRGRMTVSSVIIVPGKATGTFRTLLTDDHEAILDKVSAYKKVKGDSYDATAVANEHARWTLAYTWLSYEDAVHKRGGKFPATPEERYANLKTINTHLMERAISTWNTIDLLISFTLEEDRFIKKS